MKTKVIAFLNQKGGVGKTTSTINIGAGLAKLGKRVLLIDFDPQASLSCSLGIETPVNSIYELLKNEVLFEEVLVKKDKLSVLPSSINLSALEYEFGATNNKEYLLKSIIKSIKGYDFIFIDCPPSLGLLTINALTAAQEVYIPVQTEFLALQGLGQLMETLSLITSHTNPELAVGGIIGTRFNRRKINKEVVSFLKTNFKGKAFKTVIRENVALTEAPSFGKDIFSHNPESNGAKDYSALCKEIVARLSK
ncbi:MAG: ParA family protein [Candidatus Dependentiae bacterium]